MLPTYQAVAPHPCRALVVLVLPAVVVDRSASLSVRGGEAGWEFVSSVSKVGGVCYCLMCRGRTYILFLEVCSFVLRIRKLNRN